MINPWKIMAVILTAMLVFPVSSLTGSGPDDPGPKILAALNAGDATALSVHFSSMVDLGISGKEDSYSKTQATRILNDFFTRNPVKSVTISRQGSSADGSRFSIGEMKAGNSIFRIYYLMRKVSGQFRIQQLQIQKPN